MSAEDSEQRMHDLLTRDTKNQSSIAPHRVSEDPPVERGLRDIISEVTNSSEKRNVGNIRDIDIANHY